MQKLNPPLRVNPSHFEAVKPKLALAADGFYAVYKLDVTYIGSLSIYFEINEILYTLDYYGTHTERSQIFGASTIYFSFEGNIIGFETDPDQDINTVPEFLRKKMKDMHG